MTALAAEVRAARCAQAMVQGRSVEGEAALLNPFVAGTVTEQELEPDEI